MVGKALKVLFLLRAQHT